MFRLLVLLAPIAMVAAAGCVSTEKTENPLSPTVAGPIAGVNISQPSPIEPTQGIRIATNLQPVTLSLQNAASTGVRPITYRFEVATDVDFANVIFAREDIASGGDGRTFLRLPDALPTGRSYYWRGRAQDGANTGPYTHSVVFSIFTPVVIGRPTASLPAHNSTELAPLFEIDNSPRSGPVGTIFYHIEVSTHLSFVPLLASWVVGEEAGARTTLRSPQTLPAGSMIYWRVLAYDSTTSSDWSGIGSFLTPAATPTGPSGPTPPSGCGIPQATVLASLHCARALYPHPMNHGHRGALLNQVAWAHRSEGYGTHFKAGGNLCPQPRTGTTISCDLLVHGPTGAVYDALIDEEIPTWDYKGPINSMSNFVAPTQP